MRIPLAESVGSIERTRPRTPCLVAQYTGMRELPSHEARVMEIISELIVGLLRRKLTDRAKNDD